MEIQTQTEEKLLHRINELENALKNVLDEFNCSYWCDECTIDHRVIRKARDILYKEIN